MPELDEILKRLSESESQEVCHEALRQIYESSLYLTSKHLFHYSDMTKYTHGGICEVLQSDSLRKLLCVPRGCFKSSIGVISYPIWRLMKNPNERILIDSEIYSNSKNFLREIKAHISSPRFIQLYGEWKSETNWNEGEITIRTRTKPYKEASITCGGIGTVKVGQHYSCMHPLTRILTSRGYVYAKDVSLGMRLLTSDGHFRTIRAIQSKPHSGKMVGFRVLGEVDTNWMTPDHRVMVRRGLEILWIEAKDLKKGDLCCTPLIQGRTRAVSRSSLVQNQMLGDVSFWRFIGFWLAEGCRSPYNEVRLSFGSHEMDYAQEVVDLMKKYGIIATIRKAETNTLLVRFANRDVKEILNRFGTRATDKRIPCFALNTFSNRQRELIKAYIQGDGHQNGNRYSASSVSENLILGIRFMLAGLGIPTTLGIVPERQVKFNVMKRSYSSLAKRIYITTIGHPLMSLLMGDQPIWQDKPVRSFIDADAWWRPILEIHTREETTPVYDFEMNGTPNFYIPGAIVHNCIIGDDLNSGNNSGTPEARRKVVQHYQMNTAILEPGGTYVIIGTRYAADDLIGWILSNEVDTIPHVS